jgi:hypothetical protein
VVISAQPFSLTAEPCGPVPFVVGDVLWVESVEYPPTLGNTSGYGFWVQRAVLPAPVSGYWLVAGWELAVASGQCVRYRTVCVPTGTPRTGWYLVPTGPDVAGSWAERTQALPLVTVGERRRRGMVAAMPAGQECIDYSAIPAGGHS